MNDRDARPWRMLGPGFVRKAVRLALCAVLLAIGVAGTAALVNFSRVAAADETYGFSAYYTAARLAVLGEANGSLQDWEWFRAQTRRYGFKATDVFYGNPPSAALVMTPLAHLGHRRARVVWVWMTLAFWATGVGLLGWTSVRLAGGAMMVAFPALLCFAVLYGPVRANIEEGQVYAFAFLLQSICCWLWLTRRPLAAGTIGGILLACKGYGLPLIVLAVFRGDRRFVGGAVGGFTSLAILAGAVLGFRQWTDFFATHLHGQFSGIPTPALQTLKSVLILALHLPTVHDGSLRVLVPSIDRILVSVLAMVAAGLLFWLSNFRLSAILSGSPASPSYPVLSACVLLNLVFSPRAEEHSYPLAMTAVLLMIPELRNLNITTGCAIAGAALLAWPFHLQDRAVTNDWNLIGDFARLWGALLLLMAAMAAAYSDRRRACPDPAHWMGAYAAFALGIILTAWYVKPWRNPVAAGPLLAVSRTDADKVTLIRLDLEEREIATIPVSCKGPFGLAFAKRNWLYAACWNNSKVSLIDLPKQREDTAFTASRLPAWAMQREGSDEVWISDEGAGKVTIYRAGTSAVIAEIPTGNGSSDIVFSDQGRRAWISNEGSNSVTLLDAVGRRKIRDIPVGNVPQGMTLTSAGDQLLVTNFRSNTVSVIDVSSLRESAQVPVCQGPVDVVTSKYADAELGFVTCFSSGSVGVLDIGRLREIQRIPVGEKPFGIGTQPGSGRVYVCVGGSNRIVVLEVGKPSRILRRMKFDGTPLQIAIAP